MSDILKENPFLPEVQAQHLDWGKRSRQTQRLSKMLAKTLPALNEAEAKMRRAFNKWDKLRAKAERIERALDRLDKGEQL